MLTKTLTRVLHGFMPRAGALGNEGTLDRKALRSALDKVSVHTRRLLYMSSGMILVVFIGELTIVFVFRENTPLVAAMFGAIGVTIIGCVKAMTGLAKQMAQLTMMTALSAELSGEQINDVIKTLLQQPAANR